MNDVAPTRYFHGGPRGLHAILPSAQTGAVSTAFYPGSPCRRDKVYCTTDYLMAVAFASMVPNGTVYEVAPVDPQPDPDCTMTGLSFEASSAAIVREHRPAGKIMLEKER